MSKDNIGALPALPAVLAMKPRKLSLFATRPRKAKKAKKTDAGGKTLGPNAVAAIATVVDHEAQQIGRLYREAGDPRLTSVRMYHEAGARLAAKKASLPHGRWLPWLRENEDVLGFGELTARRLMGFANRSLTTDLTPEQAGRLLAKLWGNDKTPAQLMNQSKSYHWFTPARYVEAARRVLGEIDLDPASSPEANKTVRAGRFYTEVDDGLAQEWAGRVFLNPPYCSKSGAFVARACEEYASGRIAAAVLVLNAHATDTGWFQPLWDHTLCFTDHRINFRAGDGQESGQAINGTVFVYLGPDVARFAAEFEKFGAVVARWRP